MTPPTIQCAGCDKVATISWPPLTGCYAVNVYKSTTMGSGYTQIASGITGTSYTDLGPFADGTVYYYVVRGVNACGETLNSNEIAESPLSPNCCRTCSCSTCSCQGGNNSPSENGNLVVGG